MADDRLVSAALGECGLCLPELPSHEWLPTDLPWVPLIPGFRGDAPEIKRWRILSMSPLLRTGIAYDPQQAGEYVKTKLLALLPER